MVIGDSGSAVFSSRIPRLRRLWKSKPAGNSMATLQVITELPRLARRAADSNKGDYGKVLVVAGSRGMSGAAVLSRNGALRGGAGLVTVATPESIVPIVAARSPCH